MPNEFSDRPLWTKEESDNIWCALARLAVYADRRNNGKVGTELSEFHQNILTDKCAEVDFKKWVDVDEANKHANHLVHKALEAQQLKPEMLDLK